MSSIPFFSILIPTKGRAHLVGYAIQSVLNQTFTEFEIILVDNDDTDKTNLAIKKFLKDPRVKYFRTGGLPMIDNWEFARSQATGNYLTVLEDKQAYYPQALEIIHRVINSFDDCHLIGWLPDRIKPDVSTNLIRQEYSRSLLHYNTEEFISILFEDFDKEHIKLPRMLNSCVSSILVEKCIATLGEDRLFLPINPDFSSGYALLGLVDEYCFIDEPLVVTNTMGSVSNGQRGMRSVKACKEYLNSISLRLETTYEFMPLKHPLVINSMLNDYFRVRRRIQNLPDVRINFDKYLVWCWQECTRRDFASYGMVKAFFYDIRVYSFVLWIKGWAKWFFRNLLLSLYVVGDNKENNIDYSLIARVVQSRDLQPDHIGHDDSKSKKHT